MREEILYKLPDPNMTTYHWLLQTLGLADYEATPPLLLSEGEKKRVALATALLRAPRHGLLLDEPSLGQDAAHKARLMALARALADTGRVVIMTTHDPTLARQADRILHLDAQGFTAPPLPCPPSPVTHPMTRRHRSPDFFIPALVAHSPLRCADPRAKLLLSFAASLTVMLPLERLGVFMALYALLLLWARLLPSALRKIWRLRVLLVVLFVVDWVFISTDLAVIVVLRVILLVGVFAFFVSTTAPTELRLALERLRVPYRYAFSLTLAFQSLGLLQQEWRAIHEAQIARGLHFSGDFRRALPRLRDLVAFTVPAIVLTTRRAWGMTEAAYARGFDAPPRRPYHVLKMRWSDWALVIAALLVTGGLLLI